MRIQNVNSGIKAGYSLVGYDLEISIPGLSPLVINLQNKQDDVSKVIDVSLNSSFTEVGEGVGSWYVATIDIPQKVYELYDTGEIDEAGDAVMGRRVTPLDLNSVTLHLWGLPQNIIVKQEVQ